MFRYHKRLRRLREIEQQMLDHILTLHALPAEESERSVSVNLMWERSLGDHPRTTIRRHWVGWSAWEAESIRSGLAELLAEVPEVASVHVGSRHGEPSLVVTWSPLSPLRAPTEDPSATGIERQQQSRRRGRKKWNSTLGLTAVAVEHPIADESIRDARWPMTTPLRRVEMTVDQLTAHIAWCPSLKLDSGRYAFDPTASYFLHVPSGSVLYEVRHKGPGGSCGEPRVLTRDRARRFAAWLEGVAGLSFEGFHDGRRRQESTPVLNLHPVHREIVARFLRDPVAFDLEEFTGTRFPFEIDLPAQNPRRDFGPEADTFKRAALRDSRKAWSYLFVDLDQDVRLP